MGKKTNWQKLQAKKPRDTIKYRDVYEDQQLDRSEIEGLQTMTSRLVFTLIFTVIVFFVAYFATSFIMFSMGKFSGTTSSSEAGPQSGYQISDKYDYWNDDQYFAEDQLSDVISMCHDNYQNGNVKEDSTGYELSGLVDSNPFYGYENMSADELAAEYFTYISVDENGNTVSTQTIVYKDDVNPFAGYAELSSVTQGETYCNKTSTGSYILKDEYNYWDDYNEYQAWQLSDVLGTCYARYRVGDFTIEDESSSEEVTEESTYYNPFAGYTEMKDTEMVAEFCNKNADGKYTFKDEYNFWDDTNTYFAHQIRDKLDEYSARYDAEYNGIEDTSQGGGDEGTGESGYTTPTMAETGFYEYCRPNFWNIGIALVCALLFFAIVYSFMKKNLDAQNMLNDTTDINQYKNDQHIALPEEIQRKFDWFPDAGAHCNVQVSSMISHVMLTNKGVNPVEFTVRHKEDVLDEDGEVDIYEGEPMLDENDNIVKETVPMFDKDFAEDIFETSGVLEKEIRKYYDPNKIPYNADGRDRTKQGGKWATVAELINNTWHIPDYEPQRPAGAYIVDTEPVNTMV